MANVRFHRVQSLPSSGTIGHLYFNFTTGIIYIYNGTGFEQYGEDYHNRVTSISSSSTHQQYPSAKVVYDALIEIEEVTATALNDLETKKITKPTTEGTNGQVLTTDGNGGRSWTTVGTVKSIATSTGLTGGTITETGTIGLATTIVGSTTVSSVSSIPVTHRAVLATISANSVLSFAALPVNGYEVHVIIRNSGSSTISVTLPSSGSYICTADTTINISSGGYGEVNLLNINGTGYVRGLGN